jgi:PAS domain S-box-containing protein
MATVPIASATDSYRRIFSRAAQLLSESAGYRETLEQTLAACLPELGDFGFFDARDGDEVTRVVRAHEDDATEAYFRPTRWVRREHPELNLCALTTGRAALHPHIDDAWYCKAAADERQLEGMRRLAFRSMITVPMRHRGELIGALTLFMGRSGRRHTAEHLSIAQDLAGLASPVVANARLVERHERAENALRLSEERLRISMKAAGLGAWEWALHDNHVYWSPEYREIYGFTPDEPATFERGISVVVPEDLPLVQAALTRAVEQRSEFSCEHRIHHSRHGMRWLHSIGRPVVDASGRPTSMMGMVMDVTEKRATNRQLEMLRDQLSEELHAMRRLQQIRSRVIRRDDRLEDLLTEILDAALEITGRERGAIQLHDEQARTLRFAAARGFSPEFVEHFRVISLDDNVPSALAWRRARRVVIDDVATDHAMAGTMHQAVMLREGIRAVQSTPLVRRDGHMIGTFTTHGSAPHSRSDRELRLLDLLSREAADLIERAQSEAMLREADRRKDEFLAILAHELRNPLAPIRYAVSIAREPASTEEQRRRAESVIERQVKHMGRLLDDLLDVSRIARGTVELKRERVVLANAVAAAVEAARPLVDAKRHELSVAPLEPSLCVDADPVRLTQILTNLITNAAKYTDPGGRIRVTAHADDRDLEIRVKDTGIGIPAEMRPRLFTLFSQADSALQRSEGGLGIGLALVKGFVALHGGTVEARSDGPQCGAEFIVRLPGAVLDGPADPTAAQAREPSQPRLSILIADDNADICETCATLVKLWGHQAHVASSGVEALERIETLRPDVAVLDIGMPQMNGYEVARRVREQPWGRDMMLVAVTGWGQPEAKAQSAAAGFDEHLTKPVDTSAFERILARHAARRAPA